MCEGLLHQRVGVVGLGPKGFMNSSMESLLVPIVFRNCVRWFFVRLRFGYVSER